MEAERIARHIRLATRNVERGQRAGEIPSDLDPGIAGAVVLGGMRQVLGRGARPPGAPARRRRRRGALAPRGLRRPLPFRIELGAPMPKVIYETSDRIAHMTLNRPEARNAIDLESTS